MEKDASGTWVLLPFTETDAIDDLERQLTATLARKPSCRPTSNCSASTLEDRRRVRPQMVDYAGPVAVGVRRKLRVLFADEPVGSLDAVVSFRSP